MIKIKGETKKEWLNLLPIDFRVELNPSLIRKQELSQEEVGEIFRLHGEKFYLMNDARLFLAEELADLGYIGEPEKKEIKKINDELKELEFKAQEAWGFEPDENHHNWWLDMPGCRCPQLDNRERIGYVGAIYNSTCPWHGWFQTDKTEI